MIMTIFLLITSSAFLGQSVEGEEVGDILISILNNISPHPCLGENIMDKLLLCQSIINFAFAHLLVI